MKNVHIRILTISSVPNFTKLFPTRRVMTYGGEWYINNMLVTCTFQQAAHPRPHPHYTQSPGTHMDTQHMYILIATWSLGSLWARLLTYTYIHTSSLDLFSVYADYIWPADDTVHAITCSHLPRMDSVVETVVPNLIRSSAHTLILFPYAATNIC